MRPPCDEDLPNTYDVVAGFVALDGPTVLAFPEPTDGLAVFSGGYSRPFLEITSPYQYALCFGVSCCVTKSVQTSPNFCV